MASSKRRYCKYCKEYVAANRGSPNHAMHLVLTIFTLGLWLPIYLIASLNQTHNCVRCGAVTTGVMDKLAFWALALLVPVMFLIVMAAMWSR